MVLVLLVPDWALMVAVGGPSSSSMALNKNHFHHTMSRMMVSQSRILRRLGFLRLVEKALFLLAAMFVVENHNVEKPGNSKWV